MPATKTSQTSKKRRCRRCPDSPFIVDCAHGRKATRAQAPLNENAAAPPSYAPVAEEGGLAVTQTQTAGVSVDRQDLAGDADRAPPVFNAPSSGVHAASIHGHTFPPGQPHMYNGPNVPYNSFFQQQQQQAVAYSQYGPQYAAPPQYGSLPSHPPASLSLPVPAPTLPPTPAGPGSAFGVDLALLDDAPRVQQRLDQVSTADQQTLDQETSASSATAAGTPPPPSETPATTPPPSATPGTPPPPSATPATTPPPPETEAAKTKRVFASNARPVHEWVEGVGCGKKTLKLARKRPLKDPFTTQMAATRNYNEWVRDLFTRAESISTRTGCWMYVAVHHPSSKHLFYHYTSPKMRLEAPAQVSVIHREVSITMSALMRAERKDKVTALGEALKQTQRAKVAEKSLAKAQAKLRRLQARLAEIDASFVDEAEDEDDGEPVEYDQGSDAGAAKGDDVSEDEEDDESDEE